ncbi:MAG: hypothetical protein ACPIEU_07955, partial [Candidatus Puniceispirillaceae bacterium]
MPETKNNFIAGEWLAGDNSIENRNPSDLSDIIGHFAQASSTQLDKALDAARAKTDGAASPRAVFDGTNVSDNTASSDGG